MKQLWESQVYQIKSEGSIYLIWFVCAVLAVLNYCLTVRIEGQLPRTVTDEWALAGKVQAPAATLFAFAVSIFVMGMDWSNRMIRHDLLAGYSRKTVFFCRAGLTLVISVAGTALLMLVLPLPLIFVGGWGGALPLWNYAVRTVVFLFFAVRMSCEGILLVTLFQRRTIACLAAGIVYLLEMTVDVPPKNGLLMSRFVSTDVFQTKSWQYLGLDGNWVTEYAAALPAGTLLFTVLFSMGMAAFCLGMSYRVFQEDDI